MCFSRSKIYRKWVIAGVTDGEERTSRYCRIFSACGWMLLGITALAAVFCVCFTVSGSLMFRSPDSEVLITVQFRQGESGESKSGAIPYGSGSGVTFDDSISAPQVRSVLLATARALAYGMGAASARDEKGEMVVTDAALGTMAAVKLYESIAREDGAVEWIAKNAPASKLTEADEKIIDTAGRYISEFLSPEPHEEADASPAPPEKRGN